MNEFLDIKYNRLNAGFQVTVEMRKTWKISGIIGGSKGGARDARPPGPNSFIFMQFSAKKLKNNSTFGSWRIPLGKILDPPLGIIIITARKRSLGQGDVFTGVCLSTAGEGGVGFPLCITGHMTKGVCIPGGLPKPPCRQTPPPMGYYRIVSTSRGYASYWNAFLLIMLLVVPCSIFEKICLSICTYITRKFAFSLKIAQ